VIIFGPSLAMTDTNAGNAGKAGKAGKAGASIFPW
jgi:hypothetical protein